jgi:hypothetical protein
MTMQEALTPLADFTPQKMVPTEYEDNVPNYAHFVSPMVHPTTGEMISSYKHLMNVLKLPRFGRQRLGKILVGWHRRTIKRAKKGLIQCLS